VTFRAGRYELVQRLASGGSGAVYRAVAPGGEAVAIKVLRPGRPKLERLFRQEVLLLAELDHPHILPVLDTGRLQAESPDGSLPARSLWLAMPYCEGGTLASRPPTTFDELAVMLQQVLLALSHCHARGILHRDVKSDNLLYDSDGRLCLADFGLGARWDARAVRRPQRGGTPVYVAPEQGAGNWWAEGPSTDLHAVGVLGWSLAAGHLPMVRRSASKDLALGAGRRLPRLRSRFPVPEAFGGWCKRLAHPDPARRPALAAEALAELRAMGGPLWSVATPPSSAHGLAVVPLRRLPVVGRSTERRALAAVLSGAKGGVPRVVILEGPQGCGKTTLARWMAERAMEDGTAWVHHVEAGAGTSRDGLDETVARALGVQRATQEEAKQRVVDPEVLEALWPSRAVAPAARRGAMRGALERRSGELPSLVWVDEAQEAPEALRFVVEWVDARRPGVLLVTVDDDRPDPGAHELLGHLAQLAVTTVVRLKPLTDHELGIIVDDMLPLQPELRADVVARAEGRPAFARQLICDWIARGLLGQGDRGHYLADTDGRGIPLDLAQIWRQRLDGLLEGHPEAWRDGLQVAAVLGREVLLDEWREVCAVLGVPADDALWDHLHAARLLSLELDRIRFTQARPFRLLETDGIEQRGGPKRVREVVAVLAKRGDDTLLHRVDLLRRIGAFDDAFTAALAGAARIDHIDVERGAQLYTAALEVADEGFEDRDPRHLWALRGLSRAAYVMQNAELLTRLAARFEDVAAAHGLPLAVVGAHRCRAWIASVNGEVEEAVRHLELGVADAVAGDDLSLSMVGELAAHYLELGRCAQAFRLLSRMDAPADQASQHWLALLRLEAQAGMGDATKALLACEALREEVEQGSSVVQHAQLHGVVAAALQELGHVEESLDAVRQAIALRKEAGLPSPIATAMEAGLLLQLERTDEALAALERSAPGSEARTFEIVRLAVDVARGETALLAARLSSWLAVADSSVSVTRARALERLGDDLVATRPELAVRAWARAEQEWAARGATRRVERVARKRQRQEA